VIGAGDLDRRVQFRRATLTDTGYGLVESFANHGTPVWAHRRDVSDGERWRAGEVQAHITARFRVRSSAFTRDLSPKDRLICEGRVYDISGIKELDRRRTLEITAAARSDLTPATAPTPEPPEGDQ
jgi:SPP1 family predicted phage head-tail adaptor